MARVAAEPEPINKNRYLSFVPGNPGLETAIRVTLADLANPDPPNSPGNEPPDLSVFEGVVRWVGLPTDHAETGNDTVSFTAATLQCEPLFMDWGDIDVLHVLGAEVLPSSVYDIQAVDMSCQGALDNDLNFSTTLTIGTARWGDVVEPFSSPSTSFQPDFSDISALVDKFASAPGAPNRARAQLQPNAPDPSRQVDFNDISSVVDAFRGLVYPFDGPASCP